MTRRRSRGRSRRHWLLVVGIVIGLLALSGVPPSTSFSTGDTARESGITVVDDPSAVLGIDNHLTMQTGETCKLVDVTNRFDTTVTVTVTLRTDSEKYGNLTLGNGREGNETSFSLRADSTQRVGLETKNESTYDGDNVYYHVDATATDLDIVATDRYSTIDDDTTGSCDMTV
ncbi:hypothetical protein [Natrinema amylolyticum]|uniref:hypothetical protein n=1 Tax=Natrinema amylolyticum TaxID=2878679 RepID=UPI001CFA034B|nr:hypothetical protein [Natrinema amylolyticum]